MGLASLPTVRTQLLLVVALAADGAQEITGQCFFVYGGAVNVLRPWDAGELLARDGRWDADDLLAALRGERPAATFG